MSKMKSFRGQLVHAEQDTIHLSGGDADTGYRLKKFQLMDANPATASNEFIVKIYSVKQTSVDGSVDFSDDTLLAAGFAVGNTDTRFDVLQNVIFDEEIFNQDIYITCFDNEGNNGACNYYFELEEIKMTNSQAAVVNYKAALLHGE
jgi:hypothetical protein